MLSPSTGYQRDNSAFFNENVDVRVRVAELTEQNTELVAAAKMVDAPPDAYPFPFCG